jgi:hypothetical protein
MIVKDTEIQTESYCPSSEDPNKCAAHQFLSELRTRITTQPLPYQYGVEARALESLWEVFGQAREAMKKYPGCNQFADAVTEMLNLELRPITAKWHRARAEGRLNARDGADEFRADLIRVQDKLRQFAKQLHVMAYGSAYEDKLTPPPIDQDILDGYFDDISFGLLKTELIKDETVDTMNALESEAVRDRRRHYGLTTANGKNAIGLALSGGGIRSATFCLGVVQVLAQRGLFKDIDFLSTVSGGGYTGSFITMRLGNPREDAQTGIAAPNGPDPGPVRYLRRHAKYLAALDLKQAWSMVTATLAGMLLNWTAPLLLITLAAALIAGGRLGGLPDVNWPIVLSIMLAASAIALVWYGWRLPKGREAAASAGYFFALVLALTAAVGACWLLRIGYGYATSGSNWTLRISGGLVATIVTAAPAVIRFVPVLKKPAVRKTVLKILLLLAALIIPLGAIGLSYLLVYLAVQSVSYTVALFIISACFAAVALQLLNINLTGPHRLYRDQLARTFIQFDEHNDAPVPLTEINPSSGAPYHLINTTLNVPSSTSDALRDRKCDFFLFSKNFCGSPATDYYPTSRWKTNDAPPDLATAMAVSGAAASSYMGLESMPTLTALLTFLNVRLGFWILHPKRPGSRRYPGFQCLIREMTGIAMSEDQAWLNLSDGGHIENLGIYELLRRRCKLIISVDGEADPDYTFQGLMTLVRHAQIDFGIRIEAELSDIRPDSATGYSQSHAALCVIRYPDAQLGFLIYMKLSLTGNEPEMLRRYRINHPDFPHQSTLDQFFDEEQFEAYRQLGVHIAAGLFSKALMDWNDDQITSISEWFRCLVKNLLDGPISTSASTETH